MVRSAFGGSRESKVTSPDLCRLDETQLENTNTAWQDSTKDFSKLVRVLFEMMPDKNKHLKK